jgi:hypothetical protein
MSPGHAPKATLLGLLFSHILFSKALLRLDPRHFLPYVDATIEIYRTETRRWSAPFLQELGVVNDRPCATRKQVNDVAIGAGETRVGYGVRNVRKQCYCIPMSYSRVYVSPDRGLSRHIVTIPLVDRKHRYTSRLVAFSRKHPYRLDGNTWGYPLSPWK